MKSLKEMDDDELMVAHRENVKKAKATSAEVRRRLIARMEAWGMPPRDWDILKYLDLTM